MYVYPLARFCIMNIGSQKYEKYANHGIMKLAA
jgi:hypothetical protein